VLISRACPRSVASAQAPTPPKFDEVCVLVERLSQRGIDHQSAFILSMLAKRAIEESPGAEHYPTVCEKLHEWLRADRVELIGIAKRLLVDCRKLLAPFFGSQVLERVGKDQRASQLLRDLASSGVEVAAEVLDVLQDRLASEDEAVRLALVRGFTDTLSRPDAFPACAHLLEPLCCRFNDVSPEVRRILCSFAARAPLGALEPAQAGLVVGHLRSRLSDRDENVRTASVEAIGALAMQSLDMLFAADDAALRAREADAGKGGSRKDEPPRDILKEMADRTLDTSPPVRRAAQQGLVRILKHYCLVDWRDGVQARGGARVLFIPRVIFHNSTINPTAANACLEDMLPSLKSGDDAAEEAKLAQRRAQVMLGLFGSMLKDEFERHRSAFLKLLVRRVEAARLLQNLLKLRESQASEEKLTVAARSLVMRVCEHDELRHAQGVDKMVKIAVKFSESIAKRKTLLKWLMTLSSPQSTSIEMYHARRELNRALSLDSAGEDKARLFVDRIFQWVSLTPIAADVLDALMVVAEHGDAARVALVCGLCSAVAAFCPQIVAPRVASVLRILMRMRRELDGLTQASEVVARHRGDLDPRLPCLVAVMQRVRAAAEAKAGDEQARAALAADLAALAAQNDALRAMAATLKLLACHRGEKEALAGALKLTRAMVLDGLVQGEDLLHAKLAARIYALAAPEGGELANLVAELTRRMQVEHPRFLPSVRALRELMKHAPAAFADNGRAAVEALQGCVEHLWPRAFAANPPKKRGAEGASMKDEGEGEDEDEDVPAPPSAAQYELDAASLSFLLKALGQAAVCEGSNSTPEQLRRSLQAMVGLVLREGQWRDDAGDLDPIYADAVLEAAVCAALKSCHNPLARRILGVNGQQRIKTVAHASAEAVRHKFILYVTKLITRARLPIGYSVALALSGTDACVDNRNLAKRGLMSVIQSWGYAIAHKGAPAQRSSAPPEILVSELVHLLSRVPDYGTERRNLLFLAGIVEFFVSCYQPRPNYAMLMAVLQRARMHADKGGASEAVWVCAEMAQVCVRHLSQGHPWGEASAAAEALELSPELFGPAVSSQAAAKSLLPGEFPVWLKERKGSRGGVGAPSTPVRVAAAASSDEAAAGAGGARKRKRSEGARKRKSGGGGGGGGKERKKEEEEEEEGEEESGAESADDGKGSDSDSDDAGGSRSRRPATSPSRRNAPRAAKQLSILKYVERDESEEEEESERGGAARDASEDEPLPEEVVRESKAAAAAAAAKRSEAAGVQQGKENEPNKGAAPGASKASEQQTKRPRVALEPASPAAGASSATSVPMQTTFRTRPSRRK
jgi:hypothetical protein